MYKRYINSIIISSSISISTVIEQESVISQAYNQNCWDTVLK